MHRNKSLSILPVLVLAVLSASACNGPKGVVLCPGGNCGGNGTVAVTMAANTPPANPSLITFQVTITSIKFSSSVGTSTTVNLNPALVVDLMRLQTDSVFLGTFANIPAAQYNSVTLVLTGNANITFLNDTGSTLSGCLASHICPLSVAASSNPFANVSFSVSQSAVTGVGIDLNFSHAVSILGANLAVNFSNNSVLSAFTLPRANSNLAAGQLDLIEDFTGVVSLNNQSVTLASAPATSRGSLTAPAASGTIYDSDPTGTHCPTGTTQLATCVANNQFASMDVVLKSDGTLSIQEIEPLLGTLQDTVEGLVVAINPANATQFTMIVTNLIPAAQNSLIGSLQIGNGLVVSLAANPTFNVDTKGLSLLAGNLSDFAGQTNTGALHLGQTVGVHVIAPFTAAVATTLASAASDTVTLRWSRFTVAPQAATSPAFNISSPPTYLGFTSNSVFSVQTTPGTPGTAGVTNFDGITDGSGLDTAKSVALRALFIENTSNSAIPAFFAAKVRQH